MKRCLFLLSLLGMLLVGKLSAHGADSIWDLEAVNAMGNGTHAKVGGERYQSQWVQIKNVHIVSGTWSEGKTLIVADDIGSTLSLQLSARGDFAAAKKPTGKFSATGIFDQEDSASPSYEHKYSMT